MVYKSWCKAQYIRIGGASALQQAELRQPNFRFQRSILGPHNVKELDRVPRGPFNKRIGVERGGKIGLERSRAIARC